MSEKGPDKTDYELLGIKVLGWVSVTVLVIAATCLILQFSHPVITAAAYLGTVFIVLYIILDVIKNRREKRRKKEKEKEGKPEE